MRRRLLFATISAVMAAVVMLGIPLGVSAAQSVRDDALLELNARTATAAGALEVRFVREETISRATLNPYIGGEVNPQAFILMIWPTGEELTAGVRPQRSFTHTEVTASGISITMEISWWDVFFDALEAVSVVLAVGVVAIATGIAFAMLQAKRLSAPLVYLAASAEALGAGHLKANIERSGVEEIDLVYEELVRSADRMAARLSAERQFSADASHQLRTPLTALTMRLEEISATTEKREVRDEVEAALEQVERLVGVVDDLLGRTRKALGGSTEMVVLGKVMRQQREEWESIFAAKRRSIVVADTDATVFASPGGLAQVLATLIENSLVHGGGQTRVAVRESATNYAIVIEVSDEGDGVPEDLATEIFERDVTSGRGTGLGLALARDLVTADGGRLELSQRVPAIFSLFLQGMPPMVDLERVVPHSRKVKTRRRRR